jgi:hypothetical protein
VFGFILTSNARDTFSNSLLNSNLAHHIKIGVVPSPTLPLARDGSRVALLSVLFVLTSVVFIIRSFLTGVISTI